MIESWNDPKSRVTPKLILYIENDSKAKSKWYIEEHGFERFYEENGRVKEEEGSLRKQWEIIKRKCLRRKYK